MRYRQIIFDVDDTLIDFYATESFALHGLFAAHQWKLTNDLQRKYHSYNQGLWRKLELGEIDYEQLSKLTFHNFIKDNLGLNVDGLKMMDEYRNFFGQAHRLLPGVKDTLIFAQKQGYSLTVLSNGEKQIQRQRLELADIKNYFSLIVTSQEAGFSKPDRHIFDYFFHQTAIGPEETVFFGDGLKSDILGAEQYGFPSIWYNHRHRRNDLGLHPLFEVDNYVQFVKIMKNDFNGE